MCRWSQPDWSSLINASHKTAVKLDRGSAAVDSIIETYLSKNRRSRSESYFCCSKNWIYTSKILMHWLARRWHISRTLLFITAVGSGHNCRQHICRSVAATAAVLSSHRKLLRVWIDNKCVLRNWLLALRRRRLRMWQSANSQFFQMWTQTERSSCQYRHSLRVDVFWNMPVWLMATSCYTISSL